MISSLFSAVIYNPLYNGLVALVDYMPGGSLGLSLIALTLIVKFILFPISRKAVHTQMKMREIEPELREIKEKYKDNREQQALKTFEVYKQANINPFSSFFMVIVQIPIIIGLYWVFLKSGLPEINADILYPFVHMPEMISTMFLAIDLTGKSWLFAAAAGLTQFYQMALATPPAPATDGTPSFAVDLAKSMQHMRFVLPVVIFFVAHSISAAVALYWTTNNIFTICQELYLRRHREKI